MQLKSLKVDDIFRVGQNPALYRVVRQAGCTQVQSVEKRMTEFVDSRTGNVVSFEAPARTEYFSRFTVVTKETT